MSEGKATGAVPITDPVLQAVILLKKAGRIHWHHEMDFQKATIVIELDSVEEPYLRVYQAEEVDPETGENEAWLVELSAHQAAELDATYASCIASEEEPGTRTA